MNYLDNFLLINACSKDIYNGEYNPLSPFSPHYKLGTFIRGSDGDNVGKYIPPTYSGSPLKAPQPQFPVATAHFLKKFKITNIRFTMQ